MTDAPKLKKTAHCEYCSGIGGFTTHEEGWSKDSVRARDRWLKNELEEIFFEVDLSPEDDRRFARLRQELVDESGKGVLEK